MRYSRFCLILILIPAFLVLSCKKDDVSWELELPSTPIMTGTSGWGVVNTSYLKINQKPDDDNVVVTTLREGDIVRIESVHFLKDERGRSVAVWYNIRWGDLAGWVNDSFLDPYDTKERAETGSRMILNRSDTP